MKRRRNEGGPGKRSGLLRVLADIGIMTAAAVVVVLALALAPWSTTDPASDVIKMKERAHPERASPAPPPTTTTTTTTTMTTVPPPPSVDPVTLAQWSIVATCEEGGWIGSSGPAYPDSLGISSTNWNAYGGGTDLSPTAQIEVAQRIEAAAGMPGFVPDQNGCAAW